MAGMFLMGAFWLAFLLALVLVMGWFTGRLFTVEHRTEADVVRTALERRYASGEISEAEYLQALHALGRDEYLRV